MAFPIHFESGPGLTLGLALAAGMLAQSLARHLRLPGIVLLLGSGVLLGPDGLGLVHPGSLGELLPMLVGFSVAVILFEGALNLELARLRREAKSIQRLATVGALTTWAGGAVAAALIMGWDLRMSMLFGSLVIVTGPTVIQPLLKRIKVKQSVATVLEAEGVLVDAVGAIMAVLALEIALQPSEGLEAGAWGLFFRLGLGTVFGLAGGVLIALLLRFPKVVVRGLENVFTLSMVLALFQVSEAFMEESGIVTVTVAGLVAANFKTRTLADLKEFKEQLTVLLIGLLFVLLAADVRIDDVRALGWAGLATVLALMFLVRPLNVAASTWGTDMPTRERLFLCWLAPRGIVAAAVSSLFAQRLDAQGIEGGTDLRALVFLVIASTVLIQGLTGGMVARWLGVRRPAQSGYAILGAGPIGRALGRLLQSHGETVMLLDANPSAARAAEEAGLKVVFGNALQERVLQRAAIADRRNVVATTSNEEVNLLFARQCHDDYKVPRIWVALRHGHEGVTPDMVTELDARVLFGSPRNLAHWTVRLEREEATIEVWEATEPIEGADETPEAPVERSLLPIALERRDKIVPWDDRSDLREGDRLHAAILERSREDCVGWLTARGLRPIADEPAEGGASDDEPAGGAGGGGSGDVGADEEA